MIKPVADNTVTEDAVATDQLAMVNETSAEGSEDSLDEDMLDDPDALEALQPNARAALEALRAEGATVYCRPCEDGSSIRIPGEPFDDEELFVDYYDHPASWPDGVSPVVWKILKQHGLRSAWINCATYGVWLDD